MKILMVAPTPFFAHRGCHIRILSEIRALAMRGHEVCLVTYNLGEDPEDIDIHRIPGVPWYRKLEAGPSWTKPILDLMLIALCVKTARRFQPDVFYGHLHEGTFVAHIARRLLGWDTPLLFDVQDSLTAELRSHSFIREGGLLDRFFNRLERWICDRADHFACSSKATARLLVDVFGKSPADITLLEDGVDDSFFSRSSRPELRQSLGIPDGSKLVVYSGALLEVKGVNFLVDAIDTITNFRDDIHFLLIGYPLEKVRRRILDQGNGSRVTFTGKLPFQELPQYLSLADVAVDPKIDLASESSAKVVFYMAAGLPVVGFDTPVTRSYLGDTGVYAARGSSIDLADKILAVLDAPEWASSLAKNARKRASEYFSWEGNIEILEDELDKLTGEWPQPIDSSHELVRDAQP